jgi:hypothetical protein
VAVQDELAGGGGAVDAAAEDEDRFVWHWKKWL